MNARTRSWLDAALRRSPVQPVFDRAAARRLAVLAYHGIEDPERFGQHLDRIRRTARAVTLIEALEAIGSRRPLPRRAVLITFDDGHRSVFDVAMPMLRERGLPAVAFVVAGLIGSDDPFWWSEVIDLARRGGTVAGLPARSPEDLVRALKRVPDERRLAAIRELRATSNGPAPRMPQLTVEELRTLESVGIAIGNHTWSHPCLPRCGSDVRRTEIEASHHALMEMIGHHPEVFAYPYGDHDEAAAAILRELGYRAAFLFDHRLSLPRPSDPFAVSRLRMNSTTPLDRFRTISSGLHPTLHRIRGGV
jgi:peptidoglycan/xylan/chitin deacetylase (PgdA/CDA1 family)